MQTTHNRIRPEYEQNGRSATELLKDLRDEVTRLVRQEIALARTEMGEKASRVSRNAVYLGIGTAVAFAGAVILLIAATAGLYAGLWAAGVSHATAGWLAPLIVGGLVALIGYAMVQKGISTLKRESVVPERTAQTMGENKEWVKQKVGLK